MCLPVFIWKCFELGKQLVCFGFLQAIVCLKLVIHWQDVGSQKIIIIYEGGRLVKMMQALKCRTAAQDAQGFVHLSYREDGC